MSPWEHFHAYERKSTVDRARGGASESCRTSRLHLQLSRVGESARPKVSSTWYMCPWEHFHAYGFQGHGRSCPMWCIRELSYKWDLAELAIPHGRRFPARGTCVRGNISMRMERKWTVDRARGGVSESCRTSRLHLQLSRVGESARPKVSSTWYMCPWEHFHAYGAEIDGRSCPRWCIRELSYNSSPPAT